ncbi:MAG: hypothetical protein GY869_20125 [Planctomycetes bacterium]|nr:hypothetical protein [Planctomycetota bacterium]
MKEFRIILVLFCVFFVVESGFGQNIDVYTVEMIQAHTELVRLSGYVGPTLSGDEQLSLSPVNPAADLVVGASAGNVGGDPDVPRHNLYGYQITDPCGVSFKSKAVVLTGNHNTETTGNWAFEGLVNFLIGAEPEADWLRRHVEFFVYPMVNPDGRYTGTGRGNPEMTAEGFGTDHNRVWDTQGQGLSTIDALTTAMQVDTGGDADYLFDFHSAAGAPASYFYTATELMDCAYVQNFLAGAPAGVNPVDSAGDPGMGRIWSMTEEGLKVEYAFTPESDFNQDVNYYLASGRYYGIALYQTLNQEMSDLAVLSSNWLVDNMAWEPIGDLTGQWKLDETDGSLAGEVTGMSSNGKLYNGAFWRPEGGNFDGGLSFDEIDDYVTIDDFDYTNANNEFSVSFWFKIGDVRGDYYQYAFSHGAVSISNSLNIYFRETGQTSAENLTTNILLSNGTSWYHTTGDVFADNHWHMYILTLSSIEGGRVYIDGQTVGTNGNLKGASFDPDTDIYLGGREDLNPYRFFGNSDINDGLLDELRLYRSFLSSADVNYIYNNLLQKYACQGYPPGDFNRDCKVDLSDYSYLASYWIIR